MLALSRLPVAASILTVTTNADSGAGSLRAMILAANSGDSIVFAPSLGTIALNSALTIAVNLSINGGPSGVQINGANSGTIFSLTNSATDLFSNLTLYNAAGDAITGSANESATVTGSTISGNGAGIANVNSTVTNSTIAGNAVGIEDGTVALYDSTISGGFTGVENAALTSGNSIIDGNSTIDVGSGNTIVDLGHNLVGNFGAGFTNGVNGDIVGFGAGLGALANNGGPTQTMALLSGSLAIDAGDNSIVPSGIVADQRGTGFARISNGAVDIGAFEVQVPEPASYFSCLLGLAIGAILLRKRPQTEPRTK